MLGFNEVKNILQWWKYATLYILFMLFTKNVTSSKIEQIENGSICLKKWSEATTNITYAEIWLALLLLKGSGKFKPSQHLYISHGRVNIQRQTINNINRNKSLSVLISSFEKNLKTGGMLLKIESPSTKILSFAW